MFETVLAAAFEFEAPRLAFLLITCLHLACGHFEEPAKWLLSDLEASERPSRLSSASSDTEPKQFDLLKIIAS